MPVDLALATDFVDAIIVETHYFNQKFLDKIFKEVECVPSMLQGLHSNAHKA